jgi:[ribosomal protein S5]-alanine N-acetyltransferase
VAVAGPVEDDLLLKRAELRHRVGSQRVPAVGDRPLQQLVRIRLLGERAPPVDVAADPRRVVKSAENIDGLPRAGPEQRVIAPKQEPIGACVTGILKHGLEGEHIPVDVVEQRQRRHSFSNTIEAVEVLGPTLTLRYASDADARSLLRLGADPEVTKFFSWGPYRQIEEPLAYIGGLAGERERGERLDFVIVDPDLGPLGVTGISELNRRDRRAVVGTWLGRAHWGSGANAESKALIAQLAFNVLGIERLAAYSDLANPRSQAALTRLGFAREGVLRRWHRHGEQVHDVIVYSWLKEEWERSSLSATAVEVRGDPPPRFVCGSGRSFSSAAAPS